MENWGFFIFWWPSARSLFILHLTVHWFPRCVSYEFSSASSCPVSWHYHPPHSEAWLLFCSVLEFVSDFKPNRDISSILKVNKGFHIIKLEKMFHVLLQVLLRNLNHTESLSCSLYQSPPGLSLSLLTLNGKKNPFDSQFSVSKMCIL